MKSLSTLIALFSPFWPGPIESNFVRDEFRQQGFVKVAGFFSSQEIDDMRNCIVEAAGQLERPSGLNKDNMIFYSNIFHKSEKLRSTISQKKVVDLLCAIAGPDLWVRWDQCVAKGPNGAAFPWHQDNAYNQLKDEHFQFWIAITDSTMENGGLWLQPGSHTRLWPHEQSGNHLVCSVKPGKETFCPAKKGDVIVFSSQMLHHTEKNRTNSDRWAYVVEYMSLDHYDPLLSPPFFVAAKDGEPYGRFVETYRGHASLKNRVRYLNVREQVRKLVHEMKRRLQASKEHIADGA
jgi:ectoine hydroxylase-related dioxygenase (phytanoyl-CoA dioxygenase family)